MCAQAAVVSARAFHTAVARMAVVAGLVGLRVAVEKLEKLERLEAMQAVRLEMDRRKRAMVEPVGSLAVVAEVEGSQVSMGR